MAQIKILSYDFMARPSPMGQAESDIAMLVNDGWEIKGVSTAFATVQFAKAPSLLYTVTLQKD